MLKTLKVILFSIFLLVSQVFAQESSSEKDDIFGDSGNDLMIVLSLGAAGGVLGLSTLSFEKEPWDHSKNILYGLSFGIIVGVAVVSLSHATKSQDYYFEKAAHSKFFETSERYAWYSKDVFTPRGASAPQWLSFAFRF